MTIDEFIAAHGLTADVIPADSNPNMTDDDWARDASHWLVTIRCEDRTMAVHFSQGSALTQPPALEDVLDCVAADAASVDDARSWEEWAEDLGYFPFDDADDYRRARWAFETVERQAAELRELIGDDAYESLLWKAERL
jgi:hypothetical protein